MLKFINKTNGMYKRKYSFRMDIVEKVFEVISCIEILPSDIKIYTTHQNMVNKGIHIGDLHPLRGRIEINMYVLF